MKLDFRSTITERGVTRVDTWKGVEKFSFIFDDEKDSGEAALDVRVPWTKVMEHAPTSSGREDVTRMRYREVDIEVTQDWILRDSESGTMARAAIMAKIKTVMEEKGFRREC